ncbi:hypothetical protein MC7420_1525 [Coleofasciculus chthonoplastes PCC 7420]|jgi:hypothetical protein|uniref:Uncharacterized protein n=1 Tax=Coleofasciculus chthonoplastes PCC 7420 TaxID=118168 RepID=B4W4U7_9CYAN|nr:hypothetical protein [Coleofasciculus chthonoplastes]EDX70781.1 hypothetical protein MC7420_1525 [Coleofasciculus chthonoplastes PCC 7420]
MGEAKRRKKLDPHYGKPKPTVELQDTMTEVILLAVLLGIELWRIELKDVNWKDFFVKKINEIVSSPDWAGFDARSEEDYLKVTTVLFLTVLTCNPPVSFASRQSFYDFLINEATNMTPKEMANLLNRTLEERIFIRDCAADLAARGEM